MVLLYKSFFFFIAVLLNLAHSTQIFPNTFEILINEGDPLTIKCVGPKNMVLFYPSSINTMHATSLTEIKKEETEEEISLTIKRPVTIPGDTGYYGCFVNTIEKMTYVYVQSNTSLFINDEESNSVAGMLGRSITLSCRPSSPNYTVLLYDNFDQEISHKSNVYFDPKYGFNLKNLSLEDSGFYRCAIEMGDNSQEINYHLYVIRNSEPLTQPQIMNNTLQHIVRGQDVFYNCTIRIADKDFYSMKWTTPHQSPSSRVSFNHYRKPSLPYHMIGIIELVIKNFTEEDEGEYECVVGKFWGESKSSKVNITLSKP